MVSFSWFVVPLLLAGGALATEGPRDLSDYGFEAYLLEHGKSYMSLLEYSSRKGLFEGRLQTIKAHNTEYRSGKQTWWMDPNHLADFTVDEFRKLRSHRKGDAWKTMWGAEHQELSASLQNSTANPPSVDWRTKNVVTPVKNQGGCGSCWAFAATETVESHHAIANGKLLQLAPQAMVDCVKNPQRCGGTGGCEGATEELGFDLAVKKGLPLESDLRYTGQDGKCKTYKPAVKATGYTKLKTNDAAALETALATIGPIAVTGAAEPWMLYGGGVFDKCSTGTGPLGADLDHGIQAVGYSQDYWLIRNSWGASWGEKGYIRLSRAADSKTFTDTKPGDGVACQPLPATQTVGGECGILSDSSYPTGLSDVVDVAYVV